MSNSPLEGLQVDNVPEVLRCGKGNILTLADGGQYACPCFTSYTASYPLEDMLRWLR